MGVILVTAMFLAAAAIFIELKVVYTTPIKRIVEKGAVFGIGFSLFLSLLLGSLFGAAGVIIMMAAFFTVAITEPIHGLVRRHGRMASEARQTYHRTKNELVETWRPAFKLVKLAFLILTAPIWIPMRIRRWWRSKVEPIHNVRYEYPPNFRTDSMI